MSDAQLTTEILSHRGVAQVSGYTKISNSNVVRCHAASSTRYNTTSTALATTPRSRVAGALTESLVDVAKALISDSDRLFVLRKRTIWLRESPSLPANRDTLSINFFGRSTVPPREAPSIE
ncbi:MAG: hypothetical protein JO287_22830 [Pseudonocardiales bacterium]|nr:hypothetical protein [Pseudonocardiales bacterium]